MASKQSLHMNQGEGEASYARNSNIQSAVQEKTKHIVEEVVSDLMRKFTMNISSIVIADLGCSSGPNAVALLSMAVDAVFRYCALEQQVPQELCVVLNDLPDNDFNNVAKRLVAFQKNAETFIPVVVTAIVPGSFYKRLFSSSSVHLAFASNSVHWLSEAPEDLRKNGIPVYDADEDLRKERRPLVLEAYARQFRKDFTLFLNMRAQELVPGGQMVISLPGYCSDTTCHSNLPWDGMAFVLNDMVSRGVIDREKLDSFYIPMYGPADKELREIIEDESSFTIKKMLVWEVISDMDKNFITPKMVALTARAVHEPIIVQHFGSQAVVEEFERTVEWHVSAGTPQVVGAGIVFLCVCLTKKA